MSPRPFGTASSAEPGTDTAKYPAAFFASISTPASGGISSSGIGMRSTTAIPLFTIGSYFMLLIDTS